MSNGEYTVEIDDKGCEKCGHGRTWRTVDPNGVGGSTSYFEKEVAEEEATMLNGAYDMGHADALKLMTKELEKAQALLADGWQMMDTAPQDGTEILMRVRHRNWEFAGDDRARWQEDVLAKWVVVNDVENKPCGAGWTWSGMLGEPVAWKAVVAEERSAGGNSSS